MDPTDPEYKLHAKPLIDLVKKLKTDYDDQKAAQEKIWAEQGEKCNKQKKAVADALDENGGASLACTALEHGEDRAPGRPFKRRRLGLVHEQVRQGDAPRRLPGYLCDHAQHGDGPIIHDPEQHQRGRRAQAADLPKEVHRPTTSPTPSGSPRRRASPARDGQGLPLSRASRRLPSCVSPDASVVPKRAS